MSALWLEDLVTARLASSEGVVLRSMLFADMASIFPQVAVSPDGSTETPFIIVRYGAETGREVIGTSIQVYAYDKHGRRYYRLLQIMKEVRRLFHGYRPPPTLPGYTRWDVDVLRSEYRSGKLVDGGWDKDMMFRRISAAGL